MKGGRLRPAHILVIRSQGPEGSHLREARDSVPMIHPVLGRHVEVSSIASPGSLIDIVWMGACDDERSS